ncbi:MAG: ZIP family metal transporter [Cyanobacteria bacterium J06627_8]
MEQLSHLLPQDMIHEGLPSGVTASAIASLGTGVGAIPILFTSTLSDRWKTLLLSIGGGVMVSAAAFSLLLPALDLAHDSRYPVTQYGLVAIALLIGGVLLYGLESIVPETTTDAETASPKQTAHGRRIWLFVLAIALHHFPEGLAVGLSTASTEDLSVAIGVGLQNIPEGLMVALALRELGYGIGVSWIAAGLSGWLEPLGSLMGIGIAEFGGAIVSTGMALAAGMMLFVVIHELLPELNLKRLNSGSVGLVTGLLVMSLVETLAS